MKTFVKTICTAALFVAAAAASQDIGVYVGEGFTGTNKVCYYDVNGVTIGIVYPLTQNCPGMVTL